MESKIYKYRLLQNKDRFQKIIKREINESLFNKRYNLSGERIINGVEIYNSVTLIKFKPNLGPFIKFRITYPSKEGLSSSRILKLEQIRSATFKIQYWFSLCFAIFTLLISIYLLVFNHFNDTNVLLLPSFGIFYFLFINLLENVFSNRMVSRVEKIMRSENIEFEKF